MGVIIDSIDRIFEKYQESKNIKSLIIELINQVDSYMFAWQVDAATDHIHQKLEEVF